MGPDSRLQVSECLYFNSLNDKYRLIPNFNILKNFPRPGRPECLDNNVTPGARLRYTPSTDISYKGK